MTTKISNIHLNPSQQTLPKRQRFTHLACLHKSTSHATVFITKQSNSNRNRQLVKRAASACSSPQPFNKQNYDVLGESAYCAIKRAFSSMVFIIRELQTFTIQIREVLFYQDLHEILIRVQHEMNASFVWLFQRVFSQTPTLMVYVMILLANYSVHSMSLNFAPSPAAVESVTVHRSCNDRKFDFKAFSTNSGNNGGGGKLPVVGSGTDGEGGVDRSLAYSPESVSGERETWSLIVDEADEMQGVIDREVMSGFVAPVTVRIEEEDVEEYVRTEVVYQTGLLREPGNPMLLANYAQFLYLVARDYDRAEDYFKRASMVEPKDAEALNKYASFLWLVRKDLWAAEEAYLEAISADPNNSFYAANYAHFLWNTGGEDTCFPLDSSEDTFSSDV